MVNLQITISDNSGEVYEQINLSKEDIKNSQSRNLFSMELLISLDNAITYFSKQEENRS